jgi:anti-anti-sigma factor
MPAYTHFDVTEIGDVTVVRFRSPHVAEDVTEFGRELYSLVENDKRQKLLLNMSMVEFLNGAVLGKMINLCRKVKTQGGVLKISNMVPDVYKVFTITNLNLFFDVYEDEADALALF